MAKKLTALSDPNNVLMVQVPEDKEDPEQTGMSVEDAYRHLTGLPPEPAQDAEEN